MVNFAMQVNGEFFKNAQDLNIKKALQIVKPFKIYC